jgi:DNA-binding NtrC family response regulator
MVILTYMVVQAMPQLVLVAEKDELTRLTILYMLDSLGYVAVGAQDIGEMYHLMEHLVFNLMIVSLTVHDPDGELIASEAKAKQPKLKVIVASGHYPDSPLKPSIDAFIQKPFSVQQMGEAIKKVLRTEEAA